MALQHAMKAKRSQISLTKYQTIQKIHMSLFFCDQVRYFVDMAISRFDLGNSWLRSEARSMAKVTYEINQLVYSHCFCFVQIGPCILKTRHRQFIIWPWNCEVKVTAELKKKLSVNLLAILIVIVTQTDSKYGINMCIGIYMYIYIYFLYFRLYFYVQFTMKCSVD